MNDSLRDNSSRAHYAINVFWVIVVINIVAVVSTYFQIELLQDYANGREVSDEKASSNDLRQTIISGFQIILYIVSIIVFLQWFRRAYFNLTTAGIKTDESDSWTIWGFVIPIISLYKPYQMMKELSDKMHVYITNNSISFQEEKPNFLIGVWWAAFLIKNVIAQLSIRVFNGDDTIEELVTSSKASLASDAFDIIAALITLAMIKQIQQMETFFSTVPKNQEIFDGFGQTEEDVNTED